MKVRLNKNSIRLRLLQNEVRQLRENGNISETIVFGAGESEYLTYSLRNSVDAADIFLQFAENKIDVFLPRQLSDVWADTDEVGLYAEQNIGDAGDLKIAIEKDFVCLDRPDDEDNKNAFPHPKAKC